MEYLFFSKNIFIIWETSSLNMNNIFIIWETSSVNMNNIEKKLASIQMDNQ